MTTLICWSSADSKGISSLQLCSDSRFSDGLNHWDKGRKLFFSRLQPDVFGYVGEVLPPVTALGQLIEAIDQSAFGSIPEEPHERMTLYKSILDDAFRTFPLQSSISVLYATRQGVGKSATFRVWSIDYSQPERTGLATEITLMQGKDYLVTSLGSGAVGYRDAYSKVQRELQGDTSRAKFWAFADFLKSGKDQWTGGPPQMVRLLRQGLATPVGLLYDDERYLLGLRLDRDALTYTQVKDWHNESYEYVEPVTGKVRSKAQKYGRR